MTKAPKRKRKPYNKRGARDLSELMQLPDSAILSDQELARFVNLSVKTLQRRSKAGDGPPRTQLSERRHGTTLGNARAWIAARTKA